MEALVICSQGSPSLDVLFASLKAYNFNLPIYLSGIRKDGTKYLENTATNFGDAFNFAVTEAFKDGYNSIIMANDDVVIRPDTYQLMLEDWNKLHEANIKVGMLGVRSDWILPHQNIRLPLDENDYIQWNRYASEQYIKLITEVSPIFAAISKDVWELEKFPPLNWFSDNVMSYNLRQRGFQLFASRAYVHHVGSTSIGPDNDKNKEDAREWLKENCPILYDFHFVRAEKQEIIDNLRKKY